MTQLYLVDGSGYVFRAYFGMARERSFRLTAKDGTPTNAVYAFNQMLQRLLKDVGASESVLLGICFDNSKPTFRDELYREYKANRDAMPDELVPQIPLIHELVRAYDIPCLERDGFEADDLIATLARAGKRDGYDVTVVSADKDLMQLIEPGIGMWDPMRDAHYGRDEVKAKFGVYPEQLGDYLALVGDAVDNVPGVPKVGKKTALELIATFGSLDALLQRTDEISKKAIRETVAAHKDDALLSKKLVTLCDTAPVALSPEKLKYTGPLRDLLEPLFKRLSFSEKRVDDAMAIGKEPAPSNAPLIPARVSTASEDLVSREHYKLILDRAALDTLVAEMLAAGTVAVDTETTDIDPMRAEMCGIAVATAPGRAAYIPVMHRYLGAPKQLLLDEVRAVLGPVLAAGKVAVVGQNFKYDLHVLRNHGFEVKNVSGDAMLLSYVLDAGRESHKLDYLARVHLCHENIRFDSLVGKGKSATFEEVALEQALPYAAEDADVALRLCALMRGQLEPIQQKLYDELEMPIMRTLFEMEHAGICLDPTTLNALAAEFRARLQTIHADISKDAGSEININSRNQLAELLFTKLQLPVTKKTKTGPSTDQSVLETLAEQHPLPRLILDYRGLQKLLSTYAEALPQMINPRTHRVHTIFNQATAATGRLSSTDPNLQNIPTKSADGRRIREAFVAQPEWQFISADYSQIELRILAHLSSDEALIDAFNGGIDIHDKTSMALFKVGKNELTPAMRRRAKAVNYGLLYGMSAFRLSREEEVSIAEAKSFIDAYFNTYPKVKVWADENLEIGRKQGYVETLLGRRRYLSDLRAKNHAVRQGAERVATNTPIQGGAADLMKVAMLHVEKALHDAGLKARMLLQVHDELVLEAPREEVERVKILVRDEMQSAMALKVPLDTSVTVGNNWSLVH